MSYPRPAARYEYDHGRDYNRDRDRDRPRGSTYRPSEESRDARRDGRRPSRDDARDRRPPFGRADSSPQAASQGQAAPSVGSLASSPREPPERTPTKQPCISTSYSPNVDNCKNYLDNCKDFLNAFNDFAMASKKMDDASKVMSKCDQQQARLDSSMPGTAMESKIWQDKRNRAKAEYSPAQVKQREAEGRCTKQFEKLIQHLMDQCEKKASPATATPSLGQEQEDDLVKKLQDILKEQLTTTIADQHKVTQEALAKALADGTKTDNDRQQQIREHMQKMENDLQLKQVEEEGKYSQRLQSQEQAFANRVDRLEEKFGQEMSSLKQHCDEKVRALELQNLELRVEQEKAEKADDIKNEMRQEMSSMKQHYDEKVNALELQNQELRAEQKKLKEQLTEDKVEYVRHLDTQYKEELAGLKEQVAAAAAAPTAEIQSLRNELSTVVINVSDLSTRVSMAEDNDKTGVNESGQHHDQLLQLRSVMTEMQEKVKGLEIYARSLEANMLASQFKHRHVDSVEGISQSAEPKSPQNSPTADRRIPSDTPAQADGKVPKKYLEKSRQKVVLEIKQWTTDILGAYAKDLNVTKRQIAAFEANIASVKAQCEQTSVKVNDMNNKVDLVSATADKASDELAQVQCEKISYRVNDVEKRVEFVSAAASAVGDDLGKYKTYAHERAEAFDQQLSHLYENQNSLRSAEFANMMIRHIQANTPNMLAHIVQGISGRMDNIERTHESLERRLDPDANKRRKVVNGHMVANNQQGSPQNNYLVSFPSQNTGPPMSGHPQSHLESHPVNGHLQGQPQYDHQHSQPRYAPQ